MKKKFSIYHFLVALLIFSLVLPTGIVNAEQTNRTKGSLTIHKYEREPGAPVGEAGDGSEQNVPSDAEKLPDVEFTITQTHSYDPEANEWTEVSNGKTYVETTNGDGEALFNDLPLGRYTVEETAGPPHVNLNKVVYSVDIPLTSKDGTNVNYDVHVYPKNETIRGAVELTKVDGDNKNAPLTGAVFNLYKANGELVNEDLAVGENGKLKVDGLHYGDYYFTEVQAPDGFLLQGGKFNFSITKSGKFNFDGTGEGKIEKVKVTNFLEADVEKTINGGETNLPINRNTEFTYDINVTLPADISEYKNFVISDSLHEDIVYVDGSWTVTGADTSVLDFAQNGQQLSWSVKDFAALDGVKNITVSFKAKVKADAEANQPIENIGKIEYENNSGTTGEKETDPVTVLPTVGSLTIMKQDGETEDRLVGAEFELRQGNKVVASGTTNSDGILTFDEVDYGEYELVETKAPNGYRKLTKSIAVTIDKDNHNEQITVDNSKTGWELPTTGGIGTILFTVIGLALMAGALYLFIRRRKETV